MGFSDEDTRLLTLRELGLLIGASGELSMAISCSGGVRRCC